MMRQSQFQPHLASKDSTVVVVIDLQQRLLPLIHESEAAVRNSARLLQMADILNAPVILTEQYPQGLGESAPEVKEAFNAIQGEKHFVIKEAFSCAQEPEFLERLVEIDQRVNSRQYRLALSEMPCPRPLDVVVAGIEAHICVWQTVIGLLQLGYFVRVCHDCVGSRDARNKEWALRSMLAMGAVVTSSESIAFEWARNKNHPRFRELNKLMKG